MLLSQYSEKSENKIELRKVTAEDILKIYEWRNHPQVRRWMLNDKEISWEEHEKFWEHMLNKEEPAFIIIFNNVDCGVIRLTKINEETAEIDIFISPEFQGRGIGSEVIKKIVNMCRDLGIKKLIARVKPNNVASIKMFERNDFKLTYLYYEKVK
jgi:UDP-4-amino-4,6-dideoxy-N-acetyl-beta-L-altrosamine N-acetyltransferase